MYTALYFFSDCYLGNNVIVTVDIEFFRDLFNSEV